MMEMMDDVLGFVFSDKQFEYMLDDDFFVPNDEQITKPLVTGLPKTLMPMSTVLMVKD